jgi:hypothetical protein
MHLLATILAAALIYLASGVLTGHFLYPPRLRKRNR